MHPEAIHADAKRSLELLSNSTDIFTDFYLAGGTAAALQLGHRVSVDLDLFSSQSFEPEELRKRLADQGCVLDQYSPDRNTINALHDQVKVSFITYPYPLVADTVDFERAKLASLSDIALMKITAIASRSTKKDFIDLAVIFDSIDPREISNLFRRKFPAKEMDLYHYAKSLTYFADADQDPDPIMLIDLTWEAVKHRMRTIAKEVSLV